MRRALIIVTLAVAAFALFLSTATPAPQAVRDKVIPLIEMDNVPLTDAIRTLARKGRLNILLDPRLSQAPYNGMTVTIRWEKVTAMEALTALLENYGLMLVDMPQSSRRN